MSESFCAVVRAVKSIPPPPASGTMRLIGLARYLSSAATPHDDSASARHPSAHETKRPAVMSRSLHRIDRLLAAQDPRHIGRTFGLQLLERLDRVEGGVRGEDDVVAAREPRILGQRLD